MTVITNKAQELSKKELDGLTQGLTKLASRFFTREI